MLLKAKVSYIFFSRYIWPHGFTNVWVFVTLVILSDEAARDEAGDVLLLLLLLCESEVIVPLWWITNFNNGGKRKKSPRWGSLLLCFSFAWWRLIQYMIIWRRWAPLPFPWRRVALEALFSLSLLPQLSFLLFSRSRPRRDTGSIGTLPQIMVQTLPGCISFSASLFPAVVMPHG